MENLLDDIEKVVDDFCLEEKKEEKDVWYKNFEQKLKKQYDTALGIRQQRDEYEMLRQHQRAIEREREFDYYQDAHREILSCECGRKIEVLYRIDHQRMSITRSLESLESGNFEYMLPQQRYSRFYCGFCGREWRIVGEIISMKNY